MSTLQCVWTLVGLQCNDLSFFHPDTNTTIWANKTEHTQIWEMRVSKIITHIGKGGNTQTRVNMTNIMQCNDK